VPDDGLIRSFFAAFQKIDNHQHHGDEIGGFERSGTPPRRPPARRREALMRLIGADLACIRGGREVFAGLAFSVDAGEALLVTGPNGAGKSSLLRLVAGLVQRAQGQLMLEGGDGDRTIGEQSHYLGHQDALKPALSVRENLAFWANFLGGSATDAALDAVGLRDLASVPALYLSAGQKRRLSLARLVAAHRAIWLLDEPTSALDAAAQAMLAGLMRTHLASGGVVLAAAHGPIGLDAAQELRLGSGR
jgi:heme exporter protein A